MFEKPLSPFEKLMRETSESINELQKISALDILDRTTEFKEALHRLVISQEIPGILISGALMDEIIAIHAHQDRVIVAENFQRTKDYVDKNFIKREPIDDEVKNVGKTTYR